MFMKMNVNVSLNRERKDASNKGLRFNKVA